jgi:uncharacterized protein YecE (DUF72 family)
MNIFIGCSGFHYDDWKIRFYPENLPKKKWLGYYAKHFNTIEINNTFYRMPTEKNMAGWKDGTPDDFVFTIKANRYFTHMKRLKIDHDFRQRFHEFEKSLYILDYKLGCVLWQLPGSVKKNTDRLKSFCQFLDNGFQNVIEFRHSSWFCEEVYDIMKSYRIILCMISAPGIIPDTALSTSPVGYLRMHGKTSWYRYHYSDEELTDWKNRLEKLQIEKLYVYFNNDFDANAVSNALTLKNMFS